MYAPARIGIGYRLFHLLGVTARGRVSESGGFGPKLYLGRRRGAG